MDRNDKMIRRQVVAGLGTTLAAVAVAPAIPVAGTAGDMPDGQVKIPQYLLLRSKCCQH